jgi:uncharacterized protein YdhG (YjbR/CyaY superfamily)
MAKIGFKSVDEYIAAQPDAVQVVLERMRGAIRKAVPGAEEAISYQMPAVRLPAGPVLWFAGWKKHCSLFRTDLRNALDQPKAKGASPKKRSAR